MPLLYISQAYDCATTLALAAATAGTNDPTAIAAAMTSITVGGVKCTTFADCLSKLKAGEDIDYDGPSGAIAFDAQGNPSAGRFTLARDLQWPAHRGRHRGRQPDEERA